MSDTSRPLSGSGSSPGSTLLQAGAVFGDLELVRQIGRGSQGVVYEGRQRSMGRRVAVKILPKDATFTSEQVDRFHREAEAAGRLSHPNIVAVYGLEESGGHLLLLQEMITGGDLTEWLDEPPEPGTPMESADAREAAQFVATIAGALQHAHEHGVIHRDIKPENILLTDDGVPKLTDFGLARVEDRLGLSQTGAIMGTPHYMSPEQVTARPSEIDARTDVYALGCLLYRLLTGKVPFDGNNLQGIFLDILHRAPRAPRSLRPGLHPDLDAVCLKALEKQPDQRYQSAQALVDDLQRFLEGQTTVARPVGAFVRGVRLLNRMATSSLALLVVLVPVAWVAIDALLLLPLARGQVELHDLRLGVVGLAALVLLWPMALLARRRLDGRAALATALAALAALSLGAVAALSVREQELNQRQALDRATLAAELNGQKVGGRPDVTDLEAYMERWPGRLGSEDALMLARGFLLRERPLRAAEWIDQLGEALLDSPVRDALRFAVHDTLDQQQPAGEARAALWSHGEAPFSEWILAGDVLAETGRPAEAREAYVRAGRRPDAPLAALNLQLARVGTALCQWEEAAEFLDDYRKWFPEDVHGLLVDFELAMGEGRLEDAERVLSDRSTSEPVAPSVAARMRHSLALRRGDESGAWDLVLAAQSQQLEDRDLQTWAAQHAIQRATVMLERRAGAAGRGDQEGVTIFSDAADQALDLAEQLYQRHEASGGALLVAELGLSATLLKRADLEADAAGVRRRELLSQALAHAQAALDADPSYWQAHYNLGHAALTLQRHERGGFDGLSDDDLLAYVGRMERALELNGFQSQSLNNAAYVLGKQLFPRSGEHAHLERAIDLARRAVRLTDPARGGGACMPDEGARSAHSSAWDTLAGLQELAGDLAGALTSAVAARDVLFPTDGRYGARVANLERLRGLGR